MLSGLLLVLKKRKVSNQGQRMPNIKWNGRGQLSFK